MARTASKRTKSKYKSREGLHKMPCTGCGRHAKLVDDKVTAWFCNNCFTVTGNYLRWRKGLEMVKPLEGIKVKDIVLGLDGREYKIVGRENVSGEDKFYYCRRVDEKKGDDLILGDFFFVEKLDNK